IGFLAFLEHAGQLTPTQREIVIERALAVPDSPIPLDMIKVIVLMVLWSQRADIDVLLLEELLDDGSGRQLHSKRRRRRTSGRALRRSAEATPNPPPGGKAAAFFAAWSRKPFSHVVTGTCTDFVFRCYSEKRKFYQAALMEGFFSSCPKPSSSLRSPPWPPTSRAPWADSPSIRTITRAIATCCRRRSATCSNSGLPSLTTSSAANGPLRTSRLSLRTSNWRRSPGRSHA